MVLPRWIEPSQFEFGSKTCRNRHNPRRSGFRLLCPYHELSLVEVQVLPLQRQDFAERRSGIKKRDQDGPKMWIRSLEQFPFIVLAFESRSRGISRSREMSLTHLRLNAVSLHVAIPNAPIEHLAKQLRVVIHSYRRQPRSPATISEDFDVGGSDFTQRRRRRGGGASD